MASRQAASLAAVCSMGRHSLTTCVAEHAGASHTHAPLSLCRKRNTNQGEDSRKRRVWLWVSLLAGGAMVAFLVRAKQTEVRRLAGVLLLRVVLFLLAACATIRGAAVTVAVALFVVVAELAQRQAPLIVAATPCLAPLLSAA